jgi:hypothetical protein
MANSLPRNIWRKIGNSSSPKERATLARVFGLPKQNLPILRRSPVVSRNHRVVNRSRATAKPIKVAKEGLSKLTNLNRINPAAYKNSTWRYYIPLTRHHAYFSNSANGPLFMINTKTGARKNVPARLAIPINTPRKTRKASNTWNEYLKRAEAGRRYAAGETKRLNKRANIGIKVNRYLNGNRGALNNVTLSDLVYWTKYSNLMAGNGNRYIKHGGRWHAYGGGPITKNTVISDIKIFNNIRKNSYLRNSNSNNYD